MPYGNCNICGERINEFRGQKCEHSLLFENIIGYLQFCIRNKLDPNVVNSIGLFLKFLYKDELEIRECDKYENKL